MALERLDPGRFRGMYVLDHYGRYCFASQFVAGRRVLDVACGLGYGSHLMKEAGATEVVGVDLSEEAIQYAREHYSDPGITYVVGDLHELSDVVKGPFDVVVSFETIEHLREPARFVSACRAVIHDDSTILFSVPNEAAAPPDNPFHLHHFDRRSFDALLGDEFTTRIILPYFFSMAAALGEPPYTRVGPLHTGQGTLARVDATPPSPDGYVAVCRTDASEVQVRSLLIHSRKSFNDSAQDLHDLEEQRVAWRTTAEKYGSELAAWRAVAEEREQALAEQECASEWLQAEMQKLKESNKQVAVVQERSRESETRVTQLDAQLDTAFARAAASERSLEEARRMIAAMEATITWRIGLGIRRAFPIYTRRGRAVRALLRTMLWPIRSVVR